MHHFISLHRSGWAALALVFLASGARADEEAGDRLGQLERLLQKMQEQRAEQDRQIEVLAEELKAVQQQMATVKESRLGEKGRNAGNPVYAAFKDGLVLEDGSGNWKLQVNGRVQTEYRTYDPIQWKDDTFSIRRARFGGTFSFLKDFAVRVEGEYANDSTGAKGTMAMTYGYLDFTRWKGAKIRAGQFKPFFGLERTYSTNFLDFTELSLATDNGAIFTSTYDRGVMLHGDPLPWLNYNVYVVNGSGQNNDDVNDAKDVGGRINANLAALAGTGGPTVLHMGASASRGSIGFSTATGSSITQDTEGSGAVFFSVTGLGNSHADRSRWGMEGAMAYGPLKLQAEYIHANYEGTRSGVATPFDHDIKAWYADLNWLVTGESWADGYKSGVFGRVRPKRDFDDKEGWGAFELGLRYSRFDASDFNALMPAATATTSYSSEADAWTMGAKWLLNPNARIALNYVRTGFNVPILLNRRSDDREDAVVLRAQYDF